MTNNYTYIGGKEGFSGENDILDVSVNAWNFNVIISCISSFKSAMEFCHYIIISLYHSL